MIPQDYGKWTKIYKYSDSWGGWGHYELAKGHVVVPRWLYAEHIKHGKLVAP